MGMNVEVRMESKRLNNFFGVPDYPCVMIHERLGLVVYFWKPKGGVVLQGNENFPAGLVSEAWFNSEFRELKPEEKVILSKE